MKIIRFALIALLCMFSGDAIAEQANDSNAKFDIGCVAPERITCGCSIRVAGVRCSTENNQVHFFSELRQGAPLCMNYAGHEIAIPSVKPRDNVFYYAKGDSWVENYTGKDMTVTISYSPADSTCPPDKGEEGCESFDVTAIIVIKMNNGTVIKYSGRGLCGC